MSHVYTPVSTTLHATCVLPDDGDDGTAAAQNTPDECALDNAAYAAARVGTYRCVACAPVVITNSGLETPPLLAKNNANAYGTDDLPIAALTGLVAGDVVCLSVGFRAGVSTAMTAEYRLESNQAGAGWAAVGTLHSTSEIAEPFASATSRNLVMNASESITNSGTYGVRLQLKTDGTIGYANIYNPLNGLVSVWRAN